MKTALFIYYTPSWQTLADVVLPIAARYCERWGYAKEFLCEDAESLSLRKIEYGGNERPAIDFYKMPIGYWKMLKLRELMNTYDFIFVLDCDAMITNEAIPLKQFAGYDNCYFTEDVNGINAGSWITRNTEKAIKLVEYVINNFDAPEEQTVIKRGIDELNIAPSLFPHPSINSYLYTEYLNDWDNKVGAGVPMPNHSEGMWQPGDFILHLPGISLERRIEIFNQIKEQL
jgi:hypothetical protein